MPRLNPHSTLPPLPSPSLNQSWPPRCLLCATSSIFSTSNIQQITNALVDPTKTIGIDLFSFAAAFKRTDSSGTILRTSEGIKNYREGSRKLVSCLSPAVNVIQTFSGILSQPVKPHIPSSNAFNDTVPRQVPFPPANGLLVGIDVFLCSFL